MKNPALLTTEENKNEVSFPVLIVDKEGYLGKEIAGELGEGSQIVFVSSKNPNLPKKSLDDLIFVPFLKKVPVIPDSTYSFLFIIDSGDTKTYEILPSFIKKAKEDRAPLVFATSINKENESLVENIKSSYSKAKVVICGDIFSENTYPGRDLTNKFLYQTKMFGKIEIPENRATEKLYPIYIKDAALAILDSVFANYQGQQIFYAFPKHPPTALGICRMIQKINPQIRMDFVKTGKEKEVGEVSFEEGGRTYLTESKYSLEDRIKQVVSGFDKNPFLEDENRKPVVSQNFESKKNFSFPFFPIIFAVLILLFLPLFSTLFFSFLGLKSIETALVKLETGKFNESQNLIYSANNFFSVSKESASALSWQANLIGQKKWVDKIETQINTGKDIASSLNLFTKSYFNFSSILSGESKNPALDLENLQVSLKQALIIVKKIEIEADNDSLVKKIKTNQQIFDLLSTVQTVLPAVLAINGKSTYLVLFQNNMELRPGGGFIGSYGLLTFENGKLSDFSIHDVYDADGQLKGHVEPPYPIRRYMGTPHWYLRDSNFDVDFEKGASAAAFFLKQETGKQVDGVFGVDVSFIQRILKAVGSVHVSEYNLDVNADNFFSLTEEKAEKNFFPGSTQKKDFLGSLFGALKTSISTKKNISYVSLAKALSESLSQKHVLLAFSDSNTQNLFTVNGWSSSLWDGREKGNNLVNDFVGISEANLGVNKVNFSVKRKVSQSVSIDDKGNISSEVNILFSNTSSKDNYKNYLRIILPKDAKLLQISIDGQVQKITDAIVDPQVYEKKGFFPPKELEVERTEESGKTIYGILMNVPFGGQQKITFNHTLSDKVNINDPTLSYNLRIFKQPGVDEYPFNFSLSFPSFYSVVSGKSSFSKDILSDQNLSINFAKK